MLDYIVPRLRTKFGEGAFSHAGPTTWINLPTIVQAITEYSVFKNRPNTLCFAASFDVILLIFTALN
jgi:hypothetical protein